MEPPEKSTASLERTVSNVPKLSFPIAINTVLDLREEDNISIVDEMAGPKVSFIQRPCCMLLDARRNPPLEDII